MKRKLIDFDDAMAILAANYKKPGYRVETTQRDVGDIRAHKDIKIYSVNEVEILRSFAPVATNGDPVFFAPGE